MSNAKKWFRDIQTDIRYAHIPTPEETYDYLCQALVSARVPPYKADRRIRDFLRFCCGIHGADEIRSVVLDENKAISLHVHARLVSLLPDGTEEPVDKDYFVAIWCGKPDRLSDGDFEDVPGLVPFENRIRVVIEMTELGFHQRSEHKDGKFKYELVVGPDRLWQATIGNSLAGINECLYEGSLAWLNEELSKEKNERWFRSSFDIKAFVDIHVYALLRRILPESDYARWVTSHIVDNATATVAIGLPCELRLLSKLDGAEIIPELTLEFLLSANSTYVIPYIYLTAERDEWPDEWPNEWHPAMEAESLREAARKIIGDRDWIFPVEASEAFDEGAVAAAEPYEFSLQKKDANPKSGLYAWLSILLFRLYSLFNPSHERKEECPKA